MTTPASQLEAVLEQLVAEHDLLLSLLERQQEAMKKLQVQSLEDLARQQEAARARIAALESRRRQVAATLARSLRLEGAPTLSRLAEKLPESRVRLLILRDRLKGAMARVASRATVAGRVAGAVLGHLNTMVRLLAGAVEQAGLYTRQGTPRVSPRIGVLEAVG